MAEAFSLFSEPVQRRAVRAGLLSGGDQQMFVVAHALLTNPKVLSIDEMSAGLAPVIVTRLASAVRRFTDSGLAVLLVEQFAALGLSIGDRTYIMPRGRVLHDGLPGLTVSFTTSARSICQVHAEQAGQRENVLAAVMGHSKEA